MRTVERIADLRTDLDAARAAGRTVGLVPTMGYLHDGHVSLMQRAAAETDLAVATIFVNPLQFGPTEDLAAYPRDLERDTKLAEQSGIALLFTPPLDEMYPEPVRTTVTVEGVSAGFEGATRPTHFAGVATVVAKLFSIAGPCRAYFGEKDFQQLAVVRRMAADLSMPVDIVGCPTVREPDGLALSSRNVYLGPAERAAAPVLYRALLEGRRALEQDGERAPEAVAARMAAVVATEPLAALDYAAAVDAATLAVPTTLSGEVRLLIAARLGPARLIDNMGATCTAG